MMTLESFVGCTPLLPLRTLPDDRCNRILVKLEGQNPAGSVKDRPALSMICGAETRGLLTPGATLIEATSGNTGVALALAATLRGYHMVLVMPDNMSLERRQLMRAYGADIRLTPAAGGMEAAIDLACALEAQGLGLRLDQFSNPDNPKAHFEGTGPEIWHDTNGTVTHFVSAMGTTGTIMGVSRYLKMCNPAIQIIGVQPEEGASIPGIRRWPAAYLPAIYEPERVDRIIDMGQALAEQTTRQLARQEGLLVGISSGGAVAAAMQVAQEVTNATIVVIICDRGDRYLSTGLFPA
jgi:cysteine synthase B